MAATSGLPTAGSAESSPNGTSLISTIFFEVYKQYQSPIVRLPLPILTATLDRCPCDGQKKRKNFMGLVFTEAFHVGGWSQATRPATGQTAQNYLDWFRTMKPGGEKYMPRLSK